MVEECLMKPGTRAVCIREVQRSLEQSSKRLIEDKIIEFGVGNKFRVLDAEIKTPGGGLIIFQGMQNHTAQSIKSLEGYRIAWCEEAQTLSDYSLRLLRPTMRREDSELWFSWNPESLDDPVDQLLRGPNKISGEDIAVVQANWRDNPWFPSILEQERIRDQARDQDEYEHTWEGGYVTISDAIIFRGNFIIEPFETPTHPDRLFFGADWGFANDPSVLIRCFMEDETLYIDQEVYGVGVEIDDLPAFFAGGYGEKNGINYVGIPGARDWPIKGDSSRPETISYVRRKGFNIDAAEKWSGSVEDGIAHLKGFKKIVIHPRCEHMAQEARLYSYKVDKQSGDVLPIVVDKHNHCWDAVRYALDGYIQARGGLGVWNKLI